MAAKKAGKKKGYPGTARQRSAKISKVHEEDPSLTQKQVLGKAFGTLRSEAKKKRRGKR